jgi:RNA polymerase sigma-70 factor (ECF subfamily)
MSSLIGWRLASPGIPHLCSSNAQPMRFLSSVKHGESQLIEAARSGDPAAFTTLIQQHHEALRGLAFAITQHQQLMDDTLQEAYIKAFRSLASFKDGSSFKTWMYRIVHNAAIDQMRKEQRVKPMADNELHVRIETSNAQGVGLDDRIDIMAAVARLKPSERSAALLVDLHGFTYEAAAEIMNVPVGTLSGHIRSARTTLRSLLDINAEEVGK